MKTQRLAALVLLPAAALSACGHNRNSDDKTKADSVWKNGKVIGSMSLKHSYE